MCRSAVGTAGTAGVGTGTGRTGLRCGPSRLLHDHFTLIAVQAAATALYSALLAPYRSVAALSVAVRACAYLEVEVRYVVRALYQILMALSRPMPVTVEPSYVGLL